MPHRAVRVAPGVALFATDRGLIGRARERWVRVDLHDRSLELDLVSRLADGAIPVEDSIAAAVGALTKAGCVVDCAAELDADSADEPIDSSGTTQVLSGAPDDGALGARLRAAVDAGAPTIVAWVDERGVVIARDDGVHAGCPLCVWLSDGALVRYVTVGCTLPGVSRAFGDHRALLHLARATILALLGDARAQPRFGEVSVYDHAQRVTDVALVTPHPACPCASRQKRDAPRPSTVSWDMLANRRIAPIWPAERAVDTRPARVVYRRSRAPWRADAASLGVAVAAGEEAPLRALAEAIERFSLFHAPADRRATARELGREALPDDAIQCLTYSAAQHALPGFRVSPFAPDVNLDWSLARGLRDDRALYVPTSLVGRPPRGGAALVDATSSGYACHLDRERAIDAALLEIIERDAILLHWYAPLRSLPRIDVDLGIETAAALLATQDVDVPVVLAVATRADGSLRCGSAAATSIDVALARARSELEVSLQGSAIAPRARDVLDDVARRHEPQDHMAYYSGDAGRRAHAALVDGASVIGIESLRVRWPVGIAARSVILRALDACDLAPWIVDRSLPDVFGGGWHVVRALVPGTVELSWGMPYRRLGAPRIAARLARGALLSSEPHPIV